MPSPLVYIVLVNYKNWQDTIECLESLLKLDYPSYRIVVVDNNSENGSIEKIQQWTEGEVLPLFEKHFYTSAPVLPQPVNKPVEYMLIEAKQINDTRLSESKLYLINSFNNLGFAGGNNLGIRLAMEHRAEFVWLLNNDTVVERESLSHLVSNFQKKRQADQSLGILGAKLLYYHNPKLIQAVLGSYNPLMASTKHIGLNMQDGTTFENLKITDNDYVVGASMFVSTEFIQTVGPMSEEYFLYFEEIDWVKRGQACGYRIDICTEAKVYHKEGAAIGGGIKNNNSKSELSDYYSIRNRIEISKKYYRAYLPTVYFSLIFAIINRIKRGQFSRLALILKVIYKSIR